MTHCRGLCRPWGPGLRRCTSGTAAWLQELWLEILGAVVTDLSDDFFEVGGGSLAAAHLVSDCVPSSPRPPWPTSTRSPPGGMATALDEMATPAATSRPRVRPVPLRTQIGRVAFTIPLRAPDRAALGHLGGGGQHRYGEPAGRGLGADGLLVGDRGRVAAAGHAAGRMAVTVLGARLLLRGIGPGSTPAAGWSTCASGRPSGWPTRWARQHRRRALDARLRRALGAGSAGMSTCMPCRP